MYELQAIAFHDCGFGPGGSWDDLAVALDSDAIGLEAELLYKTLETGRVAESGEAARLAVEDDGKGHV